MSNQMNFLDEAEVKLKAWWKSFTVWLGALIIAVSQIPPEVINYFHPDLRDWAYSAIGAAIIWIRLFGTNQAVTMVAAKRPVADDKPKGSDWP